MEHSNKILEEQLADEQTKNEKLKRRIEEFEEAELTAPMSKKPTLIEPQSLGNLEVK